MKKLMMLISLGMLNCYLGFSQTDDEIFNIYFKEDFEDNTPGYYNYNEWDEDWNHPAWGLIKFSEIVYSGEQQGQVLRVNYPKGSTYGDGGAHWYSPLDKPYEELYASFRMRFKDGFKPVLSGKLPGFIGGEQFEFGQPGYNQGFVAKLTWFNFNETDVPNLAYYAYYQNQRNTEWGDSYGITYEGVPTGEWFTFTIRLVMNTISGGAGNEDGFMEAFIDGEFVKRWEGINWRNLESIGIDHFEIVSFFGGSGEIFAATRDEWAEFDDFVLFTYKDAIDVPRGNTPSPEGRILKLPEVAGAIVVHEPEPVERDADTTKIKIKAYGDELNGVNAHFQLYVNNDIVGEGDVTSSSATYEFDLISPVNPDDTVYIAFTNDGYQEGAGDRNMIVESLTYNGYKYDPEGSNVVYAFEGVDGAIIYPGTSDMYFNGQLVFFTGETSVNPDLLGPLFQESSFFSNTKPEISDHTYICPDSLKDGTNIVTVSATDSDPDQLLTFRILSGNTSGAFQINALTGKLSVANSMYLKNNDQFLLEVSVSDDHPLSKSDTALVVINVNHIVKTVSTTNIYYIDPSNINDLAEDGSMAHPFDSWGDVNWESGNTYLQKSGTIAYEKKINLGASDITLGSYGEGDLPLIRSQAKDFAMRAYERNNITIKNLHLIADEAISCVYFLGATCDNILVNNCVFEGSNNGIRIIEGKSFDISYNTFIGCVDAIYSFAEDNRIYYNVFKENSTAINVNSYLSKANIFNNVFYYNSTGVSASYSELVIYNNIFYLEEQNNQALNYNFDKLVSDNNIYYPEQEGFININNVNYVSLEEYQASTGLDMNSFTQDPQFIDVYNNNFGLKSTSPAIDAGKNVGVSQDFYGMTVPYGNAPDIGLKETQEAQTLTGITDNLEDMTASDGPVVYPNPTDGLIQISYQFSSIADMELIIKDVSGRTIFMDRISGGYSSYQTEIDISSQPTGIYLAFFNINGKSYTQKILKR